MKSNKSQDEERQVKKAENQPSLHYIWRKQKIFTQTKQTKNKQPYILLQLMQWKTLNQLKFHQVGLESRRKTSEGKAIWKWQENYHLGYSVYIKASFFTAPYFDPSWLEISK